MLCEDTAQNLAVAVVSFKTVVLGRVSGVFATFTRRHAWSGLGTADSHAQVTYILKLRFCKMRLICEFCSVLRIGKSENDCGPT